MTGDSASEAPERTIERILNLGVRPARLQRTRQNSIPAALVNTHAPSAEQAREDMISRIKGEPPKRRGTIAKIATFLNHSMRAYIVGTFMLPPGRPLRLTTSCSRMGASNN